VTEGAKRAPEIGAVVIGRNEGARLVACLESVRAAIDGPISYVDSGSTDASVAAARAAGADVVELDMSVPFTAARARNAGVATLVGSGVRPAHIQFVDGDCTLDPDWPAAALSFLHDHDDVAVVCGRRRERSPETSLFNRLCDLEWETPVGEATACGGDALVRRAAFEEVGGFDGALIAGEEPELCLRLRENGWRIWRLDAEMTRHDAAMTRLAQYWRRSVRAGHAYAEVSHKHRRSAKRIWAAETRRALMWSAIAPVSVLGGIVIHPGFFAGLLAYPAQIARLAIRDRAVLKDDALAAAGLSVLSKFAEAKGVATYWMGRARGRRARLIEYKGADREARALGADE